MVSLVPFFWFGRLRFGSFVFSAFQLLHTRHLHLQEVCFMYFWNALIVWSALYILLMLSILKWLSYNVVYAWIPRVLVLSLRMFDPRQFLCDIYLHQNVLELSSEMFDPL